MATGATEFIDSTTADVFIRENWSTLAVVAREQALVFARNVDLRYRADAAIGDIVRVPTIGNLTAQTKTKAANTANVFETITESDSTITIATWSYSAVAIESIVQVQGNRNLLEDYSGKQGYALALAVDNTLAGHPDDASNAVGVLASPLGYDDYVRAMQYLDDAEAPDMDRVFIVSPAEVAGLLKQDKYIHNDYAMIHGVFPGITSHDRAYVTSFLSYPVYKTTNVEGTNSAGHDNTLFQRQAIALILQMVPTAWSTADIDYFAYKVAFEQLYGSAILRNDHMVFMRGA